MAPPGGVLMYGALVLFESEFLHVVAISFTALILTELLMVALIVRTWHWLMVLAQGLSLLFYVCSLFFLNEYFGKPVRYTASESPRQRVSSWVPKTRPLYMATPTLSPELTEREFRFVFVVRHKKIIRIVLFLIER